MERLTSRGRRGRRSDRAQIGDSRIQSCRVAGKAGGGGVEGGSVYIAWECCNQRLDVGDVGLDRGHLRTEVSYRSNDSGGIGIDVVLNGHDGFLVGEHLIETFLYLAQHSVVAKNEHGRVRAVEDILIHLLLARRLRGIRRLLRRT